MKVPEDLGELGRATGSRRALGLDPIGDGTPALDDEPAPRRTGLAILMAVLGVVSVTLAVQSLVGFVRAREVEVALGRSQAEQLQRTIGRDLRTLGPDDMPAAVATALIDYQAAGLRYLAVLGPRGIIVAEGGQSVEAATVVPPPGPPSMTPDRHWGSRWRIYSPAPPRPPFPRVDDGPPRGRPPGPLPFVVEVEADAGRALRNVAVRSLVVGTTSAVALVVLAILLTASIRRHDRASIRRARDRRLAALGEMSAVLAHEIRNPLASLKGHAQLLVENLDDPARVRDRAKAVRVVDEAIRLERLTQDLLEFARTGRIARAPCEPAAVLARAAAGFDASRLTIDDALAPPRWSLDAGRMIQVLTNLIDNALAAAPGPVSVEVTTVGGALIYRVRDHGPGLPGGELARSLEPFVTTSAKGTGLGLAVARRLVALHDGTLTGRNHPDGGAELTVTIPPGPG